MKTNALFCLFMAALIVAQFACKKDKNDNPKPTAKTLTSGDWNWVMSKGTIVGITTTPASTGNYITRRFLTDSICLTTENGTTFREKYFLRDDTVWQPGHVTHWLNLNGINYVMTISNDTLLLSNSYVDGSDDYYTQ
ncbi:MAG: hypothetical protein EBZ77_02540 [Chitinophagia bacterium]|nr:hypothetical protein [Chitinophagia bacterium]